jgi:uncharacterized protein
MLILLSPSKTMDFSSLPSVVGTVPTFCEDAIFINQCLRKYKAAALSELLGTSEKLTTQSLAKIKAFEAYHNNSNSKPALVAYSGDVYGGLDAKTLTSNQLQKAFKDILILSSLYGILRGSDLVQPYRLDISAPIPTKAGKTLYPFWKSKVTTFINQYCQLNSYPMILNLASDEYAKAIDWLQVLPQVVNVDFLEEKNGKRKVISYNAKRARGIMASMVIKKNIEDVKVLTKLDVDGYRFDKVASTPSNLVFVRS